MRAPRLGAGTVVACLSALVLLGPALSPGLVQAYDLGWSPDPRFTPAVLGLDAPAPRVLPSDAVGVLLGLVLGAGLAQKVVLLAQLIVASLGAQRLLADLLGRRPARLACIAGVLAAQWNPYVIERLAMGQWTVLWGYALIPWAWSAALRLRRTGDWWPLLAMVAASGLGGSNSLAMVVLALVPVLLWPPVPWRGAVLAALAALGAGALWWLPAVLSGVSGDSAGTAAFAPRSDSPLGLIGSLLSGGGIWSASAWPPERATWVLASTALLLALAGAAAVAYGARAHPALRPLLAGGLLGLGLAVHSGWELVRPLWTALLGLPGGGLLRDGHKLLAPWVVVIVLGLALLADRFARDRAPGRTAVAWLVTLAPIPLLLSAAWGLGGRLDAVPVPADLRAAATRLSQAPEGKVGLLPWNQYRRYAWNDARISLSLVPRMVDQRVLHDDSLPLRAGRVAGERADSAQVSADVARGVPPIAALRRQGVRYLVVERRVGLSVPTTPPEAKVLADGAHVLVVDLTPGASATTVRTEPVRPVAALVSVVTGLLVLAGAIRGQRRARRM